MSDDYDFGDADPEDAYDEGDPLEDKVDVLERAIVDILTRADGRREVRRDALRELIVGLQRAAEELRARVEEIRAELAEL